MPLEYRLLLKT